MRFIEIKENVPKYIIKKLLSNSLKDLPAIKIDNRFYKYKADKTLKLVKNTDDYITPKTKKYKIFRSIMSYFKENNLELREYFVGMIIYYNGTTFDYSFKIISASIYNKKTEKLKHYNNGIYSCLYGEATFFINEKNKYNLAKRYLLKSALKAYIYKNEDSLKVAKNKYLRSIKEDLSIYDFIMLSKHSSIETYYKTYELAEFGLRIKFYENFLIDKLPFNYKIFVKSHFHYLDYYFDLTFRGYQTKYIDSMNKSCILKFVIANKIPKNVINYIINNAENAYLYCDYYLNRDSFKDKIPLFPKDIVKAHNELFDLIKFKQDEMLKEQVKEINNKRKFLEFTFKDYEFYLPNVDEMVNYSKDLNICIAKAGYIKRVAKGETILLFCKNKMNDNKFNKFASELDLKDYHIIQFHGYCNDINASYEQLNLRNNLMIILNEHIEKLVIRQ